MSASNRNDRSGANRPDGHGAERLDELLLERALFGLSEADELALGEARDSQEALEYELGAAAVAVAFGAERARPLPPMLSAKLQAGAKVIFDERETATKGRAMPAPLQLVRDSASQAPRPSAMSYAGWLFAAAAAVLALIAWWPQAKTQAPSAPIASRAELRTALLARVDSKTIAAQGQDPFAPGATGDIVWSNEAQEGFIRLVGAPVNDPQVQQYQLWIFDEAQEHPVDGGVFDVSASGEVLIPIDAKLRVTKPTLFAITLEKPGGVVVSDRQRIAIVAPL